jgi:hypothetical protein
MWSPPIWPRASGGDGRMPARVVEHLLAGARGINLLYHIVVDGRNEIAPRARDEKGKLMRWSAVGATLS